MATAARRIGPVPLVLLLLAVFLRPAPAVATPAVDPLECPLHDGFTAVGVNEWQQTGPDIFTFVCNWGYAGNIDDEPELGLGMTVEMACPPAAQERFASVTGDNLVQRDGTLSYESEEGTYSTYTGDWTLNEKVFWIPDPQVFVTFATYADRPVWLTATGDIASTLLETLAIEAIAANRQVLPGCPDVPSTTPSATPSATPSPSPSATDGATSTSTATPDDQADDQGASEDTSSDEDIVIWLILGGLTVLLLAIIIAMIIVWLRSRPPPL